VPMAGDVRGTLEGDPPLCKGPWQGQDRGRFTQHLGHLHAAQVTAMCQTFGDVTNTWSCDRDRALLTQCSSFVCYV